MSVLCNQEPKTGMTTLGAYEYNPTHANLLGTGAFALVYKGRVKNKPDEPVAIKIMKKDTNMPKNKTLLSKEISVLKDLHHENIVRLYDHGISNNGVYLVMEYCNGGDLSEYLIAKGTLPEDTIRHFLLQIGSAMDAINRKGFMHRDLKPGNILLSHCRNCNQPVTEIPGYLLSFKLADFGFARFLQDGMMAVTMCGSPMYMEQENTSKTLSNLIPHSQLPTYHAHAIPLNEPDLDNIDEMSRTTVDEYFEDELDTSALPLEPTPVDVPRIDAYCKTATAADALRPTHLQPPTVAPPVPCRGSSVGSRSSATHYALTQTSHGRRLPFGVRPMAGFEPGEAPPLEDYVIVNPDGSGTLSFDLIFV
ncbi:hypothetical protein AHF37_06831 [Paragonimus kellicotti]|nr:hypothetical protein AHF37_06831 [Paragonimus kellicotti]